MKDSLGKYGLVAAFTLLLGACANTPAPQGARTPGSESFRQHAVVEVPRFKIAEKSSSHATSEARHSVQLASHFARWKGTPYRFGGNSRSGIDCSGFVYVTFRDVLGITTPRTTAQLVKAGKRINEKQLSPGDLVFFNTGGRQRHVGIYIGDGKFMHASTSRGVVSSRLDSPYWARAYRESRRFLANRH
ncbi:MAG: C40 family peptidase [Gammaproteobacteria bacterium]|nr:C40 family peptidase [Gammaproteobacteria bacterium]NND39594.1 hypothetical protein [Pseudomonadales bacterium]NNM12488.1 hypothetical protein [Pseudomonadales bacterium]RZV56346.1 MAG: hypothetical protein EX270_05020 [Pseudomonadales bacterium]